MIKRISIKNFSMWITFILFIISSGLTAYGVYQDNILSDETTAYLLSGVFVGLGLVVVAFLMFQEKLMDSTNERGMPLAFIGLVFLIWMTISPMYNFVTFVGKKSVEYEAKENYLILEKAALPYIIRDNVFMDKTIPTLRKIQEHFYNAAKIQDEDSGRGAIYDRSIEMGKFIENNLLMLSGYSRKSKKNNPTLNIRNDLKKFSKKISSEDSTFEDIIKSYTKVSENIANNILKLSSKSDLKPLIIDINEKLMGEIEFLKNRRNIYMNDSSPRGKAIYKSTMIALSDLPTKQQAFYRSYNEIINLDTKVAYIKPSFPNMSIGVNLALKHVSNYWSAFAAAILIDLLAFASYFSFLIAKNRTKGLLNRQISLTADLDASEKKEDDFEAKIELILDDKSRYDKDITTLKKDYQSKIKNVEESSKETIKKLKNNITELESNLKEIQTDFDKNISSLEEKRLNEKENVGEQDFEVLKQIDDNIERNISQKKINLESEVNRIKEYIQNYKENIKSELLTESEKIKELEVDLENKIQKLKFEKEEKLNRLRNNIQQEDEIQFKISSKLNDIQAEIFANKENEVKK
ncbi:coiled-coil domain-containing protein [Sulfurimonas sp.]